MKLVVKIKKLKYDESPKALIKNTHLSFSNNSVYFIMGKTGCGKTTLLKSIAGTIPNLQDAKFDGQIWRDNKKIPFEEYKKLISFSFQEPEHQFLLDNVEKELFFGLSQEQINFAKKLLKYFKIENLIGKSIKDISSGQRKLISLISALSQDKPIKIMDEPTANLDKKNKEKFKTLIKKLKRNSIIILSSHDSSLLDLTDKIIVFDEKSDKWKESNKKMCDQSLSKFESKNLFCSDEKTRKTFVLMKLREVCYCYPDGTEVIKNVNFDLIGGDFLFICGDNGAGKTTLIHLLTKKIKPSKGKIDFEKNKRIAIIMQEPEKQLFSNSVLSEVLMGIKKNKMIIREARRLIELIGLDHKINEHPFFLSRGQKQLLLILSVLMTKPNVLIIDEPFTGLDKRSIKKILDLLILFYKRFKPTIIISDQESTMLDKLSTKIIHVKNKKCFIK